MFCLLFDQDLYVKLYFGIERLDQIHENITLILNTEKKYGFKVLPTTHCKPKKRIESTNEKNISTSDEKITSYEITKKFEADNHADGSKKVNL